MNLPVIFGIIISAGILAWGMSSLLAYMFENTGKIITFDDLYNRRESRVMFGNTWHIILPAVAIVSAMSEMFKWNATLQSVSGGLLVTLFVVYTIWAFYVVIFNKQMDWSSWKTVHLIGKEASSRPSVMNTYLTVLIGGVHTLSVIGNEHAMPVLVATVLIVHAHNSIWMHDRNN